MSARAQAARGYRMRPGPRKGRATGRGSRIQWDRIGRVALVIVLFLVLASYIGPSINFLNTWRDSKSEQANLAEMRQENARLHERAEELSGPDAAEHEARKMGMIDPSAGEAPFVVKGLH